MSHKPERRALVARYGAGTCALVGWQSLGEFRGWLNCWWIMNDPVNCWWIIDDLRPQSQMVPFWFGARERALPAPRLGARLGVTTALQASDGVHPR